MLRNLYLNVYFIFLPFFKAYLIGVGDVQSEPGRAALYDINKYQYATESLQLAIDCINKSAMSGDKQQLLDVFFFNLNIL